MDNAYTSTRTAYTDDWSWSIETKSIFLDLAGIQLLELDIINLRTVDYPPDFILDGIVSLSLC